MSENTVPISNNHFSIYVFQGSRYAKIRMMMHREPVNTSRIPATLPILRKLLPGVLSTECFNDEKIPFHKEVKKTEVGHLFEHILLEYLCMLKIEKGHRSAMYEGRTNWNWKREPMGLFHIHIKCSLKDADILPEALDRAIGLMKIILTQEGGAHFDNNKNLDQSKTRTLHADFGLKNGKKLKA